MGPKSMRIRKVVLFAGFIVALTGCAADRSGPIVESFEPPDACSFVPGSSRWAGSSYRETARVGDKDDVWFSSIGGVHWAGDQLYVFDMGYPRVIRFTEALEYIGEFGREGDGPGELQKLWIPPYLPWRRLHGSKELLIVYDAGRRVSVFDVEGNFRGNLITNAPGVGMSVTLRGVRLTPYGLLFDWHSQHAPDGGRGWADSVAYQVRRWADGTVSEVVELQVAAYPLAVRGGTFRGPHQAVPLWDVEGSCVVVSDGASPWLVVASIDGSRADTLAINLPNRKPAAVDRKSLAEVSAMAGGGSHMPEPTAIRRIRDLIIDPDGHVWLLPIQPDPAPQGGVEVLRVSIATRETFVDTIPAFPVAFGPPGVQFATPSASLNEPLVIRVEVEMGVEDGQQIVLSR